MAEDVVITGLDGVPEWASEKTLADMLKHVEKMSEISDDQKGLLEKSLTEIQKTGKVTAQNAKAVTGAAGGAGATVATAKAATTLKTALIKTADQSLDTAAGFKKLPGPLADFTKSLKNSSKAFKVALVGVGLVGNVLGKYYNTVKEGVSVVQGLTETGVRFGGSFLEISQTLSKTGLTFESFGAIAEKYGRVMSQNGLQGLIDLTTAAEGATGGFFKLGLTTAEATEYAAEYLDQQRIGGVFGKAASDGQAKALKENMEMFTSYSKVLNVSRKDIQDAGREMLSDADLKAELNSMDAESRTKAVAAFQKTSAAFASLGEPGMALGKIFTDIAASPVAEASEGFQQLANAGLGDLANRMAEVSAQNKSGVALTQEQLLQMVHLTEAEKQQLAALRLAGGSTKETAVLVANLGQAAEEARISQARLAEEARLAGKSLADYVKTVDPAAEAATHLQDEMQKFQATAEYGMVKSFATLLGGHGTDAVHAMANALGVVNDKLASFIEGPMVTGIEYLKEKFMALARAVDNYVIEPFKILGGWVNDFLQYILIGWDKFVAMIENIPGVKISESPEAVEPVMSTVDGIKHVQSPELRNRLATEQLEAGKLTGADKDVMAALQQIIINTSEAATQTGKVNKTLKGTPGLKD